jgi:hypothetical protein
VIVTLACVRANVRIFVSVCGLLSCSIEQDHVFSFFVYMLRFVDFFVTAFSCMPSIFLKKKEKSYLLIDYFTVHKQLFFFMCNATMRSNVFISSTRRYMTCVYLMQILHVYSSIET